MSYFVSGDGSGDNTPKLTEDTVILTKNNIPMRFEAGYYNEFTVTTDPTLLKAKTIKYKHHQHSASSANATYEDGYTDARGAKGVGEWSATGGGCYTQRVKRGGLRILEQRVEEVDRSGGEGTAIDRFMNSHWKCTFCGQEGWSGNQACPYGAHEHWQYKIGCGKSNGQLISADIYY